MARASNIASTPEWSATLTLPDYGSIARDTSGVVRRRCRDCTGISLIHLAAGMVLEGFRRHAKVSAVLSVMRVKSGQTTRDPIHAVIPDESFLQPLRRSV